MEGVRDYAKVFESDSAIHTLYKLKNYIILFSLTTVSPLTYTSGITRRHYGKSKKISKIV